MEKINLFCWFDWIAGKKNTFAGCTVLDHNSPILIEALLL